jgi:hypothetical protein
MFHDVMLIVKSLTDDQRLAKIGNGSVKYSMNLVARDDLIDFDLI